MATIGIICLKQIDAYVPTETPLGCVKSNIIYDSTLSPAHICHLNILLCGTSSSYTVSLYIALL